MDDVTFHVNMARSDQTRKGNIDQAFKEFFEARAEWDEERPRAYEDRGVTLEDENKWEEEHPEPGTKTNPFKAGNGVELYWTAPNPKMIKIEIGLELGHAFTKEKLGRMIELSSNNLHHFADAMLGNIEMDEEAKEERDKTFNLIQQNRNWFHVIKEEEDFSDEK